MAKIVDVKLEYAKDKNIEKEDVKTVVNWVKSQPHLPEINELQAIAFLKKNFYYVESTKKNIDTFFTLKKLWPDIFGPRDFTAPPLKGILDVITFFPLPKKTPEGYTLIFMKVLGPGIVNYDLCLLGSYLDMTIMSHLYTGGTFDDYLFVVDLKNLPVEYIPKLEYLIFKRYFYFMHEVMPGNPRGFHYIDHCPYMDEVLNMVRAAVPKALLPNIHKHNSVEDIEKYIPIELLPKDYGGSQDSVVELKGKWQKQLLKNAPLFEWESKQTIDEKKRPSTAENVFKIEKGLSAVY